MAWAYLTGPAGVPMGPTFNLAIQHHLIVRAFYINVDEPRALGHVQSLAPGDTLLLFYVADGVIVGALRCTLVDALDVGLIRLNEYPELVDLHPVIAEYGGYIPDCFAVAPARTPQAQAIEHAGYLADRKDSQIGQWVALAVTVDAQIDHVPAEWQGWHNGIVPMAPLHVFPEELAQIAVGEHAVVGEHANQPEPPNATNTQPAPGDDTAESISSPDQTQRSDGQEPGRSRCTRDIGAPPGKAGVSAPLPARGPLRLFDVYIFVDWSGAGVPGNEGADNTIWYAVSDDQNEPQAHFCATRQDCTAALEKLLQGLVRRRNRVLIGFDFPYGYPQRCATALGLTNNTPPWLAIWKHLQGQIQDNDQNANNRWQVAADMNAAIGPQDLPGPFWGCPKAIATQYPFLQVTQPGFPYCDHALSRLRITEQRFPGVKATWQLFYNGSVGSQTLLGIPRLSQLRYHPELVHVSSVWPFETGFVTPVGRGRCPWILHAEIWPGLVRGAAAALLQAHPTWTRDRAQVVAMCNWAKTQDEAGQLAPRFGEPDNLNEQQVLAVVNEEGWILGTPPDPKVQQRLAGETS